MALWGDRDNLDCAGTVTLVYDTGIVTGAGTSFGATDNPGVGDVIRFGDPIPSSATSYEGDAVIVSVANTQQCTIGSTAGLSGSAISGIAYTGTQLPKYTVLDHTYSDNEAFNRANETFVHLAFDLSQAGASAGSSIVAFNLDQQAGGFLGGILKVGDAFKDGGVSRGVVSIGTATVTASGAVGAGTAVIPVADGINALGGAVSLNSGQFGSGFIENGSFISVVSGNSTSITLGSTISVAISANDRLLFGDTSVMIGLGSTITNSFGTQTEQEFLRLGGGFNKMVFGVSEASAAIGEDGTYDVAHAGWVGIHTYRDCEGNFRVKSEVLVASSGINTGNAPIYPPA